MRGTRTVIPQSLRSEVLHLSQGHQGIVKMKNRPKMYHDAAARLSCQHMSCGSACASNHDLLLPHSLSPLPSEENLLVVVDD